MAVTGDDPRPASEDLAALEPYVRWARFVVALLIAVVAVGLALVPSSGARLDPDQLAAIWPRLAIIGANLGASLLALGSLFVGLGRRSPWALHAVLPVCVALIAIGVARALIALTQGNVTLPLEAIAAVLVLTRPHAPDIMPPATSDDRRRVTVVTAVVFASTFVPIVLPLGLAG
jgi:hypothetical protein